VGCLLLVVLIVGVPILEVQALAALARATSAQAVLVHVVVAGVLGVALTRRSGSDVTRRLRQDLATGQPLSGEVFEGPLRVLAGLLLVVPGPITDVLALLLLVPPLRRLAARGMAGWARRRFAVGVAGPGQAAGGPMFGGQMFGGAAPGGPFGPMSGGMFGGAPFGGPGQVRPRSDVIDVEAVVREPEPPAPPPALPDGGPGGARP
jgi:UPF0716 protein FxsA